MLRMLSLGLIGIFIIVAIVLALPQIRAYQYSPVVLTLFSQFVSERSGYRHVKDIEYGPHARHRIDIYLPATPDPKGPVVLFLYGGTWKSGHRSYYGFVGAALAKRGITVVVPDYRLFPEVRWPAFQEDAAKAYAWVTKELLHHEQSRTPSARQEDILLPTERPIIVMGHSAGAHIAALLAFDERHLQRVNVSEALRPKGLVGLSGPYGFDPTTDPLTHDVFATAKDRDEARPLAYVTRKAPSSLLFHGGADTLVREKNQHDLASALRGVGVSVESRIYKDLDHTGTLLALAWPFRGRAPVLDKVVQFIQSFSPTDQSQK